MLLTPFVFITPACAAFRAVHIYNSIIMTVLSTCKYPIGVMSNPKYPKGNGGGRVAMSLALPMLSFPLVCSLSTHTLCYCICCTMLCFRVINMLLK